MNTVLRELRTSVFMDSGLRRNDGGLGVVVPDWSGCMNTILFELRTAVFMDSGLRRNDGGLETLFRA